MDARNVARGYGQDRSHNFDLFHHAPGVWLGDIQPGRALARQCNEYMAQLGKDHPGRFGFFAALPLPDTDGSLKEIAYTLDVLKADGIGLMTNYNDKWSGKAAFAPVFEELNRRKAVVYFHPSSATCCTNLMPNVRQQIIEYPHDSIRAVLSMLLAGTFVKYRDIRFIFSHGGGTIPFLAGRIKQMTAQQKDLPQVAPQGVEYELKRLYYEIANASDGGSDEAGPAGADHVRVGLSIRADRSDRGRIAIAGASACQGWGNWPRQRSQVAAEVEVTCLIGVYLCSSVAKLPS